ncbi:AEC family transporter [Tabrizicola piscis]|uniref:AEC family transporter n=1 Tax=Tabrizicola piscis TaxID=2494374 RepID=A0A3S8U2E0_9RHOB|nr:AEC family transporter [Tabrizicola piscis]AZL57792.1 AEC family transporter [Tabrizicola piscis]
MSALLDVILPVFLIIGFGYVAVRWLGFKDTAVDGVMSFAQSFALPLLLFASIARLDLGKAYDAGLMLSFYIGAFGGFAAGFFAARILFARPVTDSIAFGFVALFSNSLLLGVPITERAYGTAALEGNFAIISIHAPVFYAFGITLMELARSRGLGLSALTLAKQVASAILTQPLVIGILCGFVVNLAGLALPGIAWSAIDMVIEAALPAALFGLGGVLCRYRPEGDLRAIALLSTISLVLHPAITWVLATQVFALDTAGLRSAVLTAAMAPGVNAYVFANLYGVAKRVAASTVLLATGLSIISVWVWLQILP